MRRIELKQEFHGEPDPCEEEWNALDTNGKDEVVFDIVGGTVSMLAPSAVPDDQLMEHNLSDRYICCQIKLENGGELSIWIDQDSNDMDVHLTAPRRVKAYAVPIS